MASVRVTYRVEIPPGLHGDDIEQYLQDLIVSGEIINWED